MEKVKVCWVIPTEPSLRESIQAACPQAQIDFCERTALDEQRVADAEVVIGNLPKRWLPEARAAALAASGKCGGGTVRAGRTAGRGRAAEQLNGRLRTGDCGTHVGGRVVHL